MLKYSIVGAKWPWKQHGVWCGSIWQRPWYSVTSSGGGYKIIFGSGTKVIVESGKFDLNVLAVMN